MNSTRPPASTSKPEFRGRIVPWRSTVALPAVRLLCFPYAGGSASIFRPWVMHGPEWLDVCAVELPGRGVRFRERLLDDIVPLVAQLTRELEAETSIPVAVFGHSYGALIAFALVQNMEAAGFPPPVHCFLSGASPRRQARPDRTPLFELPSEQFAAELRRYGGTPKEVLDNRDLMHVLEPILRADFRAAATWRPPPGARIAAPITTLAGAQDQSAQPSDVARWSEYTRAEAGHQIYDGGHFFLHQFGAQILGLISESLTPAS